MRLASLIRERRARRRARSLSAAVAALPVDAKRAMLAALEEDDLIVGAYTDRRGRICPMLAAHRRGVRTQVGDFPGAWDAFGRARRPRLATTREREILRALLSEGLAGERMPTSAAPSREAPPALGSPAAR